MASSEAQLRASEIRDVLLQEIDRYESDLKVEEVGEILEVKDGVARIYGLTDAMASEMLEITSSQSRESPEKWAFRLLVKIITSSSRKEGCGCAASVYGWSQIVQSGLPSAAETAKTA